MRTKMADIEIEVIQVEELGPDYRLLKDWMYAKCWLCA
jgi:hypothetical protein